MLTAELRWGLELVSELKGWCHGEGLDEAHAVMVIIPEDVNSVIEETVQSVKSLGRVRVRGRTFNLRRNQCYVLCECKEEVTGDKVPPEVSPAEGGGAWSVITAALGTQATSV